uniref:Uncharacterized protein n=1 Tax=Anguilla anguilla TaxID=7936 RepID=A0A0E9S2I4_ANGAN
MYVCVRACLC